MFFIEYGYEYGSAHATILFVSFILSNVPIASWADAVIAMPRPAVDNSAKVQFLSFKVLS